MKINEFKLEETRKVDARFSPKFPEVNEEEQLDEGPCDVATKSDIEKMTGDQYVKYAKWKADCEKSEQDNPSDDAELDKMFDGKSPHKKGTKKYKKHMAAIHAGESADPVGPTVGQMSDEELADYLQVSVEEVKADREHAEEVANDMSQDHAEWGEGVSEDSPDEEDWENDVTKTLRKIVDEHQAQKVKFDNGKKTTVDAFTASAVIQGLDALRPDLQVKAADFINKSPGHLVKFSEMVFGSQKEGYGESIDPVGLAVNVMREAFSEYEKDSSKRWNRYSEYRDLRHKMAYLAKRIEDKEISGDGK